ncbi:hypothetical protein BKA62DRAFT_762381, partial [Auriculariales sp. MPI-PUGE-AT-0066]
MQTLLDPLTSWRQLERGVRHKLKQNVVHNFVKPEVLRSCTNELVKHKTTTLSQTIARNNAQDVPPARKLSGLVRRFCAAGSEPTPFSAMSRTHPPGHTAAVSGLVTTVDGAPSIFGCPSADVEGGAKVGEIVGAIGDELAAIVEGLRNSEPAVAGEDNLSRTVEIVAGDEVGDGALGVGPHETDCMGISKMRRGVSGRSRCPKKYMKKPSCQSSTTALIGLGASASELRARSGNRGGGSKPNRVSPLPPPIAISARFRVFLVSSLLLPTIAFQMTEQSDYIQRTATPSGSQIPTVLLTTSPNSLRDEIVKLTRDRDNRQKEVEAMASVVAGRNMLRAHRRNRGDSNVSDDEEEGAEALAPLLTQTMAELFTQ